MKNKTLVLLGFIILKFVLQYLLIGPEYELHRDEFLHLDQSRHLAWGYISVPPVTSWIAWLIRLLGNGIFWVKFFPALFGALTIVVVWKTIEALKGNLFALSLGATAILVSVILRINLLFQPNSFDIFFWTLLYYTIVKYISSGQIKWIYFASIVFAFGMLAKYNIVFLLAGLAPAILLSEHRKLFLNKHLYFACFIAGLIILPNIAWQIKNHFPTISQLRELAETQLVHVERLNFVKEQFLFFISSIFILAAGFISFFTYLPFKRYRLFCWSFLISFGIFVCLKAKGYYAIGLYPAIICFGAAYLEKIFSQGWKRWLKPLSFIVILALSIPFFMVGFPVQSPQQIQENPGMYKSFGLLTWEDGKEHQLPQDFADMTGWKNLAYKTDSAYELVTDKEHTLVMCDNYGEAGAINYYSKFRNMNAVSFNADYINWMQLDKEIKTIILIKDPEDTDSLRENEKRYFTSIKLIGKNDNIYSREKGAAVYVLSEPKININKLLKEKIDTYKKRYTAR